MAETIDSLSEVETAIDTDAKTPEMHVQRLDTQGRSYATGKRKDAIARVWIKLGSGSIVINGKGFDKYFVRPVLQMILRQPIVTAIRDGQFDIVASVSGGGLSGQAGAVRHGIAHQGQSCGGTQKVW